jgi:flagellar hook protein FlgE
MSFQQGLSGLNASSKHLDTIGNNVANASTVGFKQSQAQFADMFAASLSGSGTNPIGTGTKLAAVAQQFTQGNITNTNNPLDTAISGQGFFRMTDASGAVLYSRNGQFQVDKNGNMVNNQGHIVSGYLADASGVIVKQTVPLQIKSTNLPPVMTTTTTVGANLDSRAAVPLVSAFSPTDPTSYTSSTSLSVFDSLGASHVGTLYFQRQPIAATSSAGIIPIGSTSMSVASASGLAVGNTVTIPGAGGVGASTTDTNGTAIGATSVTLGSVLGLSVGSNIKLLGNTPSTVTSIIGNVVNFSPASTVATAAGNAVTSTLPLTATISSIAGIASTTDTVGTAAGSTSATLASVAGLAVGSNITLAGNAAAIITGIAGNVVTFAPATTVATALGAVVSSTSGTVTFTPATTTATIAASAISSNSPSSNWNAFLTVDNALVPAVVPPATAAVPFATLGFSTTGALTSVTPGAGAVTGATLGKVTTSTFNPVSNLTTSPQSITFDFNSLAAATTQFGGTFGVNTLTQNGYTSGQLNSTSTGVDGTILGRYSNGQSRALGQIILSNFTNPQGLQPVGNNEWVETSASGGPTTGTPGSASLGSLQSSATEDSNVDLTAELVNMITAQRVYQANAQTIKTQDQLLQTIVSLR